MTVSGTAIAGSTSRICGSAVNGSAVSGTAASGATAADTPAVPVGIPVGTVIGALRGSVGVLRWRCFWCLAYLLNVAFLLLAWLLNVCAPHALEWFDVTGPVIAFVLRGDRLEVFESARCCIPLPCLALRMHTHVSTQEVKHVQVYVEQVQTSVLLMEGGQCPGTPIALDAVDYTMSVDTLAEVRNLPDCKQIASEPYVLRQSDTRRGHTSIIGDFNRCFLGALLENGDLLRLSRTAVTRSYVVELFSLRDMLRARLAQAQTARPAQGGVQSV